MAPLIIYLRGLKSRQSYIIFFIKKFFLHFIVYYFDGGFIWSLFYFDRYAEFFKNISMYLHVSILFIAITSIPPSSIMYVVFTIYIVCITICTLDDAAICYHTYLFHFSVNIHTRRPCTFFKIKKNYYSMNSNYEIVSNH